MNNLKMSDDGIHDHNDPQSNQAYAGPDGNTGRVFGLSEKAR